MNPSFQKNTKELYEARNYLQSQQNEWQEALENLKGIQEDAKNADLFIAIHYLTFCDQFCKNILLHIKEIDSQLNNLAPLKENFHQGEENFHLIYEILLDMQELKNQKLKKMQNLEEEYANLAEQTLQQAQNLITKFSKAMIKEKVTPNLEEQVNQNLEKDLFLQELKDSLELYREAREDFVAEVAKDFIQQLPKDRMPEDLGEETPEIDSILSQLDTAITACDTALLIQDTGD